MGKNVSWKGVLIGAITTLLLLLLIALIVVLTGAYNVAATDRHAPPVGWALDTTMENSVRTRAEELVEPVTFTPAMIAAGGTEYKEYCEHCHGGVGASRAEWAKGMRPFPPPLARVASQWDPAEVFWIVNHGIKMTGMPAFGPTHSEETIWNIAAFVRTLPQMSADEYAAIEGGHHHGGGGQQAGGATNQQSSGGHSHASGTADHSD